MHTTVKICTLKYLFPASNLLTQQCVVVHQNSAAAIYAVEVKACCLLKSMLLLSRYYTTGLYNNYTTLSQNMISWWFEMLVTLHCDFSKMILSSHLPNKRLCKLLKLQKSFDNFDFCSLYRLLSLWTQNPKSTYVSRRTSRIALNWRVKNKKRMHITRRGRKWRR